MKEKIISQTTGMEYSPSDVVRIVNYKQAASYMAHGATLLDIYASRNFEDNTPLLVFIFNRSDTREMYDLWCKHELK